MFDRKNERRAEAPLTYGAAAARLKAHGYLPTSAIAPSGSLSLWPAPQYFAHDAALISEHPVAVRITALVLAAIEDNELDERVRAVLDKRGLLSGPVRTGSDNVEVRPLTLSGTLRGAATELDGAVVLLQSAAVPLDAHWSVSLLDVPAAKLPAITAAGAEALFADEVRYLAINLRHERAPKPKASRLGWIGQ